MTLFTPTSAPSDTRRSTGGRTTMTVGLTLLILAVVAGGWLLITRVLARQDLNVAAQASAAGAQTVKLTVDNADLTIAPSTDGQVHVHATGHYSGTAPTVTALSANGVVDVTILCAHEWLAYCSLAATVEMPVELGLSVTDDNGDIELTGIQGDLDIATDNGDVNMDGSDGAIHATSDNGNIGIDHSASTSIRVDTDNGNIEVRSLSSPTLLDAQTNNGDIDLTVPGESKYLVDAQTNNGTTEVKVGIDTDSTHKITAISDNGDVTVRPAS